MVNDLTARQGARSRVLRSLALVAAFGLAVTGLAATATTATAADNASISGTVTATAGGAPIEDATVTVHAGDAGEDDGLWSPFATAVTGADGAYSVTDLPAGLYRVEFRAAGYAREYWQNVDEFWDSTVVTLTGGENRGSIDASLADAGSVSGTVTAEGGTPVSGAEVAFYSEETDGGETYWSNYIEVTTGDDGSYTMPNLPSGDYRVSFRAYGFLEEYWDGATTLDAGDDVSVTVGGTTSGIDAVLDDGAKIKGTVTLPGGAPAVGHSVVAWAVNDDWGWTTYAEIAADGSYTLSGLLPGPYTVRFYASHESPYVTAYYGGEVFEGDATTFTLGADTTKTGIDHEFVTGATVQGTVTVPGGAA